MRLQFKERATETAISLESSVKNIEVKVSKETNDEPLPPGTEDISDNDDIGDPPKDTEDISNVEEKNLNNVVDTEIKGNDLLPSGAECVSDGEDSELIILD